MTLVERVAEHQGQVKIPAVAIQAHSPAQAQVQAANAAPINVPDNLLYKPPQTLQNPKARLWDSMTRGLR